MTAAVGTLPLQELGKADIKPVVDFRAEVAHPCFSILVLAEEQLDGV